MNDIDEPPVIILQIFEPCQKGFFRASVNTDGLPETEIGCASPGTSGIVHWVNAELGLQIVDRLSPAARWKPGDAVTPGLYILETLNP